MSDHLPVPAFADDSVAIMNSHPSPQDIEAFFQLTNDLQQLTGLSINPTKSEVLLIGSPPPPTN